MSDQKTIIEYINNKIENEMFDVKREYYHENKKYSLIKDVLAFVNSPVIGDKFIVFNIDNDTFQLSSMDMNTLPDISDINTLLREYCEPNIAVELNKFHYNSGQVAYLKICGSNLDYPYIMKKDFVFEGKTKLHQGQIYIRRGATNFIANRSDLDYLVNMRTNRTLKIDSSTISQKQIVLDRQFVTLYTISFVYGNNSKTNFLINSGKLKLATSTNVFSVDIDFISEPNIASFNSSQKLSAKLFDVAASTTIHKNVFFKISSQCKDVLTQDNSKIKVTLMLSDVNDIQVISTIQLCGMEND